MGGTGSFSVSALVGVISTCTSILGRVIVSSSELGKRMKCLAVSIKAVLKEVAEGGALSFCYHISHDT